MTRPREIEAMRLAIVLSAYGLGTTSPNPPVGCVILRDGGVVGTGFHERKGEPHAEAIALRAAGELAYGATAVVTLEPCNHVGRTPACRQALLDSGIRRVVIAVMDPTSRGEGGAAVLRANGVDVEVGLLADEARLVLGPWLTALEIGRPTVTAAYPHDEAVPGGLDALETELRPQFDVLIREDGSLVEEGLQNGHGNDVFRLPPASAIGEPNDTLTALYVGGARTVLLIGRALADAYAAADLLDHLVVVRSAHESHRAVTDVEGFALTSLTRHHAAIRTTWSRQSGHRLVLDPPGQV